MNEKLIVFLARGSRDIPANAKVKGELRVTFQLSFT